MRKLITKPHLIFIAFLPVFLVEAYINQDNTIDINVHDTYLVIATFHIYYLLFTTFLTYSLGYWLLLYFKCKISQKLINLHLIFTFIGALLFYILEQLYFGSQSDTLKLYIEMPFIFSGIAVILGQVFFPANVALGVVNKLKKTK